MADWYSTREAVKRAAKKDGSAVNAAIDRMIEAGSRSIDNLTGRRFIPLTETREYAWPQPQPGSGAVLWIPTDDLISVATLKSQAQDAAPVTIPAADYFLEPSYLGPPYTRIEIDQSSDSAFEAGDTPQRSISVLGNWGYRADTVPAGTVASGMDGGGGASATTFVCSDASLIGVGDTLLIENERLFVSERGTVDTAANTNGALNADKSQTSVVVTDGTKVKAGEVVLIDSERMLVEAVAGNSLTVVRAYDGSTLAAHADARDVYAFRTLTVVRGANGTTGATHANATAIAKYAPPADVALLCVAEAIAAYEQEHAAWGRLIGTGEGQRLFSPDSLNELRARVQRAYGRVRSAAV